MAQYDIAAATRRVSPVQEMMQYGLQQDARKINALNIQKAEIQMPYVEELTKQQVRRGELGIEEAETRMPFLKTELQQKEEMTELQIDQMHRTAKQQQRLANFQDALSSGKYSTEEIRDTYPIEYGQWRVQQLQTQTAELNNFKTELAAITELPPEKRVAAFQRRVAEAPEEMQQYLRGFDSPEKIAGLERALNKSLRSAAGELLSELEYYRSLGTEQGNYMAGVIERMLEKQIAGNPTQMEALASANWPNSPRPVQDQMDFMAIQKTKDNAYGYRFRQEYSRITGMEMATLEAMDINRLDIEARNELGAEGYRAAMDRVQASTEDYLRGQYGDKYQWYKHHRARLDGVPENERPMLPERVPKTPTPLKPADLEYEEPAKKEEAASRESGYTEAQLLEYARAAVAQGADEAEVRKRLKEQGVDPGKL